MKKRFISLFLVIVFISAGCIWINQYEDSNVPEQETIEQEIVVQGAIMQEASKLPKENETPRETGASKEKKINFEENNVNIETMEKEENNEIKQYYGTYEIAEFWPTIYYNRVRSYGRLARQEVDMMLGHIVEIQEDSLVTYECFRWNGVYAGKRVVWSGNYQIEKVSMENPQYTWESIDSASMSLEEFAGLLREDFPYTAEFTRCREKICGRITVTIEASYVQEYYVMEGGIMMRSTMTGEYFYLKKLDKEPDTVMVAEELSEEEKEAIMQKVYGSYTITEFMPTKYYPALESGGEILLPQEEADMMIGREVVVGKEVFTTYSNNRLPNSKFKNRSMEEYLLEEIEILAPDYRIERECREDIYGLRDDILPKEMQQEEYIEINVYPGYERIILDAVLPQMYLLNDGRLLLYAMGEYFLLEKCEGNH